MIKRTKKIIAMIIAASVLSTSVLAGANTFVKGFQDVETDEYLITKVSNTEAGPGEVDGILTGEDQDRAQSYTWSMIESGDSIYIGSCYNPITGIFYRNLVANLTEMGIPKEKAENVATALIELMYDGAMEVTLNSDPVIMKVDKKTYDVSIAYKPEANSGRVSGYRMAAEFDGKLYFASHGAKPSLIEIDPSNNDEYKIVYTASIKNYAVACGIRGLLARDGELLLSVTTDESGEPGAKILSSSTPSDPNSWTEIANQETFNDYPALYIRDGINGGAVWDLVEFNNSVYATIVTSKTDANTMETTKQGFAMFRGDKDEVGNWTWTEVIGDKANGAKYDFGLGVKQSSAGNIFVYNGYLYIGNYNDPMLSLAEIPNNGNMRYLYEDFRNSINLYRMDANENIELIGGQATKAFPNGPIGNMGTGLGNNTNQYVWRMGEHNGKLYVGTYDSATISNMFTNLTNGELVNMSKEEFLRRIEQIKNILEALMSKEATLKIESELETTEEINNSAEAITENLESADNVTVEETEVVVEESKTDEVEESAENLEENKEELLEVETPLLDSQSEIESLLLELELFAEELDETPEIVENISEIGLYSVEPLTNSEIEMYSSLLDVDDELIIDANDTILVMIYKSIMKIYDEISPVLPEEVKVTVDEVFEKLQLDNIVYYMGLNKYARNSVKGFDLLVSQDGVNFEVLTNDGFGDEYNHGIRAFASTEEGLFIGTANPFYGAQLWLLTDKTMEPVDPEIPVDPEEPTDPEIPVDPEDPTEPEVPVVPEEPSTDDNSGTDGKGEGNLPNTGGVDSNALLALATALTIGGGLCLRKKSKK